MADAEEGTFELSLWQNPSVQLPRADNNPRLEVAVEVMFNDFSVCRAIYIDDRRGTGGAFVRFYDLDGKESKKHEGEWLVFGKSCYGNVVHNPKTTLIGWRYLKKDEEEDKYANMDTSGWIPIDLGLPSTQNRHMDRFNSDARYVRVLVELNSGEIYPAKFQRREGEEGGAFLILSKDHEDMALGKIVYKPTGYTQSYAGKIKSWKYVEEE